MEFKEGKILGVKQIRPAKHKDNRGWLTEFFRSDQLKIKPVMSYLSFTLPGKARGPHEHLKQTDVFFFMGGAKFKIVLWDNRKKSKTYINRQVVTAGKSSFLTLVIPPGVVHGYKNVSGSAGMIINCPDKLYKGYRRKGVVDEIRHEDSRDGFYQDFLKV